MYINIYIYIKHINIKHIYVLRLYIYYPGTAYFLEFPCLQDFRWEVMESDKKYHEAALYAMSMWFKLTCL